MGLKYVRGDFLSMVSNGNEKNSKVEESEKEELDFQILVATQTLERNIGFINNCDTVTIP